MLRFLSKSTLILIISLNIIAFSANATDYYVNDNATMGDVYCTAVGNIANDGLFASSPLPSLNDVIAAHGPGGTGMIGDGDVFYIDAGTYFQTDANLGINLNDISIIGAGSDLTVFDNAAASSDANRWANIYGDNIVIQGVYITGYNYGVGDGIALQIDGATNFTITDVMVNENLPGGGSAAIFITGGSTGTFNGGGSSCNPAGTSVAGGGVNVVGNGNVISFNNYNISNNTKDVQGGAGMYISGDNTSSVTISNSLFEGNETDGSQGGGAIFIQNGATLSITGSCFNNNNASQVSTSNYGGALNVGEGSDVTISNCSFNGNFASSSGKGGAISVYTNFGSGGAASVSITQSSFSNNSAPNGSDLYTEEGFSDPALITCVECTFSGTSDDVHADEGAIELENSGSNATVSNTNATFIDNDNASLSPSTVCPSLPAPCFSILPVELVEFTGACIENGIVKFEWKTLSELNNDYFLIEQLTEDSNWSEVAKIAGAGTTQQPQQYECFLKSREEGYYRLKQVDYDGQKTDFESIYVDMDCSNETGITTTYFLNEGGTIVVEYMIEYSAVFEIELFNSMGQLVHSEESIFRNDSRRKNSKISKDLSPGVYYLRISNTQENYNFKLFKH